MRVLLSSLARKTYPTGNPNFAVMQAFPAGIDEEDCDPFLMCDYFGPMKSKGKITDPDQFEVPWHPHRGMDILTYLVEGTGRHADSLGNREEYESPGMQWISVGSGVEHAEGGGTPLGQSTAGFQIWVNVPAAHKMDDPRYGTEPPEKIPNVELSVEPRVFARLLAGSLAGHTGPFKTVQDVQIMDLELGAGAKHTHLVAPQHDNCILFLYKGHGTASGTALKTLSVARMDASTTGYRGIDLEAGPEGLSVLVFAGKRLREPIAWRGPFVMSTPQQLEEVMDECRRGAFPPVRAPWDYRRAASKPQAP